MTDKDPLLKALAATPTLLVEALDQVKGRDLSLKPSSDQWSILEILGHLLDVERRYIERIERLLTEEYPQLPEIHPDISTHDPDRTSGEVVRLFGASREQTLALLQDLEPATWTKRAVHESIGETDLAYLIQHLAEHDRNHINQLLATGSP